MRCAPAAQPPKEATGAIRDQCGVAPDQRLVELKIDQGPGEPQSAWILESDFLNWLVIPNLIAHAHEGHWESGRELLRRFSNDGALRSPQLIEYVAQRIKDWVETEFDPEQSQHAFRVTKPANRDPSGDTRDRQVRAIEVYLLCRGKGYSKLAALQAAGRDKSVNRASKTIEDYVVGLHDKGGVFSPEQIAAINAVRWGPLWNEYRGPKIDDEFLAKALGASWQRWKALESFKMELLAKHRPKDPD